MKFDENNNESNGVNNKLNIETLIFNRTNTEAVLECLERLLDANSILNLGIFIIGLKVNQQKIIQLINFLSSCRFTRLKCLSTNLFQEHILTASYFEANSLATMQTLIAKLEKLYLCYYDIGCYSFFVGDLSCCQENVKASANPLFGICGIDKGILADNIYPAGGGYWRPLSAFDFSFERFCFDHLFDESVKFSHVDSLTLGWTDDCDSCDFDEVVSWVLGYFARNAKCLKYLELRFVCVTCNGSAINNHRNECEFKNLEMRLSLFAKSETKYKVNRNRLKIYF